MAPEHTAKPLRLKRGDRFWFRFAEDPSEFEELLSKNIPIETSTEDNQHGDRVFHVSLFSSDFSAQDIETFAEQIKRELSETYRDCGITFLHLDNSYEVSIPRESLTVSNIATEVIIHRDCYKISKGSYILFWQDQVQFDIDDEVPSGHYDLIGLVSLMTGERISRHPIIECYYAEDARKFLVSNLIIMHDEIRQGDMKPLSFSECSSIDSTNVVLHTILWFAGRAFTARDHAQKIIFYHTALEICIGNDSFRKEIKKLYAKSDRNFSVRMGDIAHRIKASRNRIVHNGKMNVMDKKLERYAQAFLIDLIAHRFRALPGRCESQGIPLGGPA